MAVRYSVQAAARATGVSEHRIRTWERRYGVPQPARDATGRRLYEEADLGAIQSMARLIDSGLPASEAARSVLRGERMPEHVSSSPPLHPTTDLLLDAARRLDGDQVEQTLRELLLSRDPEVLDGVIMPLLGAVGMRWEAGSANVAGEHFVSEIVRQQLIACAEPRATGVRRSPTLVLACPPGEQHDLGLLALWHLLRPSGARLIYLGCDVPSADIIAIVQQVKPDAVVLGATTSNSVASLSLTVRLMLAARVRCRIFAAGPALDRAGSTDVVGERLPRRLRDAAASLARLTGD